MILPHSRCSFGVVFLVSILEVRSKEELQKLPMESMANLAAYLCHESCTSTGGVFELGGHWIARLGWRRSRGARFHAGFSVEE